MVPSERKPLIINFSSHINASFFVPLPHTVQSTAKRKKEKNDHGKKLIWLNVLLFPTFCFGLLKNEAFVVVLCFCLPVERLANILRA
jgi:hypothetical protein